MRLATRILFLLVIQMMFAVCAQADPIRVALYVDEGTGDSREDVAATLSDTALFDLTRVLGADIRAGILQDFDALIHPGGSGSGQAESLMDAGLDSVRAFVERGGGVLGICAGSYLLSSDYDWSLNILNTKVIDRAHWNRGGGSADILFSGWGREFFGFDQDTVMVEYRQGALMAPALVQDLPGYIEVGTFQTEFTENGAPEGVMIGTSAFAFSRYHEGRAAAFSPHPEITPGREHMIPDAIQWLVGNEPYLGIATPRNHKTIEVSAVTRIEWVAEDMDDPVLIEFSPDGGSTWENVASGAVEPYNWTAPAAPAESCVMRISSLSDGALVDTVHFAVVPAPLSIQSLQSGNWSDPATWDGNIVPETTDNVVIGSGHTVTVDADAGCRDLSFVDGLGRLAMESDLYIHGDFNRFGTSANPFYDGGNLWPAGPKMIFSGDADVQAITGLGTTSSSPYPLRFQSIVVDKPSGKLTTQPVEGLESGYRLGIGVSLEIVSGTFELAKRDDIEGRTTAGTASTPTITVGAGGVFKMLGSYSHIRRGNFIGEDSSKIGKMTVCGEAYLACSSSNRINIGDIDVEDGGTLHVPYYTTGGNMGTYRFNPGTITVKAGGTYKHQLINDIWYDNTTTPNQIALLDGGTVFSGAGSPQYPAFSVNEGTVTYARGSSAQTVFPMDYHDLAFTGTGGGVLSSDITVNGTCSVTGGTVTTGDYIVTLGPDANLVESDGKTIVGKVEVTRNLGINETQVFGGIGLEILAAGGAPGVTQVIRTTGTAVDRNANEGIARLFQIFPSNNTGLDASVLYRYDDSEVVIANESLLLLFSGSGNNWTEVPATLDITENTLAGSGINSFCELIAGYEGVVATMVQSVSAAPVGMNVDISWSMFEEVSAENFTVIRLEGENRDRVTLPSGVVTTDDRNFSYVDSKAAPGSRCCYQVVLDDGGQSYTLFETDTIEIPLPVMSLGQNYPNPFNPMTTIEYSTSRTGHVVLDIYDVSGRRVNRIVDSVQEAGVHTVNWMGTDHQGNSVASGTYFYRMTSDDQQLVRKMVLVR